MATLKLKVKPGKEKTTPASKKRKKDKAIPKGVEKVKKIVEKKEEAKSDKEILKGEISDTLQKTFANIKKAAKVLASGAGKKIKEIKKSKTAAAD